MPMPASWTCCRRDCTCPSSTLRVEPMSSSGTVLSKSPKSIPQVLQTCLSNTPHLVLVAQDIVLLATDVPSKKSKTCFSQLQLPIYFARSQGNHKVYCKLVKCGLMVVTNDAVKLIQMAATPSCLAFALEANSCFFQ